MTKPSQRAVAYLVAGTFFIELLDATIITTALPYMAADFGIAPSQLSIGISSYLLAIALFIPMSGWITQRIGARRTFCTAIIIFTVASILCGLSTEFWFFVIARVIQGIGGSLMVPVGRLLVLRNSPKRDLVRLVSIITWPGLVAPILGPPIGGLLSEHASWHWIFFINVPLGITAFIMALRLVQSRETQRKPFDWPGFIFAALALISLTVAMEYVAQGHLQPLVICGLVAACAAATTAGVRHLKRAAHPLFSLDVLRVRSFQLCMRGGSLFRITIQSVPFLLPLMYQVAFGFDGFTAGLFLLALFAGNLGIKPVTTILLRKFGFYVILVVNGALLSIGFGLMALLQRETPIWAALALIAFSGICRSIQLTSLNTGGFSEVDAEEMTDANTLASLVFQVGATIGIGLAALLLSFAARYSSGNPETPDITAFHLTFIALACIAALGTIDMVLLPKNMGREVSGHRR